MTKQFDLPAFMAFVAGKDPNETYDRWSARHCALGQFGFVTGGPDGFAIPRPVYEAAVYERPSIFGALLSRLNNLPADPPTAAEGGDDSPVSALTPLDGERA